MLLADCERRPQFNVQQAIFRLARNVAGCRSRPLSSQKHWKGSRGNLCPGKRKKLESNPFHSLTMRVPRAFLIFLVILAMLFRSEEHTSELQSRGHLVCRLLLEKK